ncbi:DUF5685 family protein [Actinokineospora iranica]|uniref:Regulatory protein n=1 Tax=Actinokineospora iranica TaxID=1271860 RepID=A0A1G6JKM9_9PSEU|nr:DUF5685 family protein [Actinokineospora iranica]SDC19218.1 hypothetical protein SAMN05216174_101449 [Actinokineospora iranica]
MFGILRPCRHRLRADLATTWLAHLCGLCLALRDDHGQFARTVTNYDGLAISALVEAQTPVADRRMAGPCALRGLRSASVADGAGARLAAAVSLVLASAKVGDHVEDRDGVLGRRPVAGAARRVATRWARQGAASGDRVGFATAVLLDAVGRQGEVEAAVRTGMSVLTATEPTETATAAAFAHTATLAGLPGNEAPLREAGRLFGRVAHLLDAVEDLAEDAATGAWNPLAATRTSLAEARRLCDDAVMGVRLALSEARFHDGALVHALLVHELGAAVHRTFRAHGGHQTPPPGWQRPAPPHPPGSQPTQPPPHGYPQPGYPPHQGPGYPPPGYPPPGNQPPGYQSPGNQPPGPPPPPHDHGGRGGGGPHKPSGCLCYRWPKLETPPKKRNIILGCFACLYECGTCQVCCRDPYPGAWSGKPRSSWDCDCGDCGCCDCGC